MLHIWDAIEADFLRDYGIRLVEQLDHMSWRYFLTLANNLSPWGAAASRIEAEQNSSSTTREDEQSDKADADAFFARVVSFGGG